MSGLNQHMQSAMECARAFLVRCIRPCRAMSELHGRNIVAVG
jgi:hypothetical protein